MNVPSIDGRLSVARGNVQLTVAARKYLKELPGPMRDE
jgi:hypothetical protein